MNVEIRHLSCLMEKFINYAVSSEYGFESVPDSDMILVKSGAGMETSYDLQIARKPSELTADEVATLNSAKSIMQVLKEDETVVWEELPVAVAESFAAVEAKKLEQEIDLSSTPPLAL